VQVAGPDHFHVWAHPEPQMQPRLVSANERYQIFRWERDVECLFNEAQAGDMLPARSSISRSRGNSSCRARRIRY
jgi:hypothetical protein